VSAPGGWRPDRADIGLAAAATAFGVCDSLTQTANHLLGDRQVAAALVTGFGGLLLLFRRRFPITVAAVCAVVNLVAFAPAHVILSLYAAGAYSRSRASVIAVSLLVAVGEMLVARQGAGESPVRALMWSAFYCGGSVIGILSRRYTATIEAYAEALIRERAQMVQRARLDERARIAREMHDVVSHRVSLMVVEAGAMEVSAGRGPEWVATVAGRIRASGRQALEELRRVMGVLDVAPGDDAPLSPQHGVLEIKTLADGARVAGLEVSLAEDGDLGSVPPAVGATAYRVVQESLTNSCKHGGGAPVRVALRVQDGSLVVRVTSEPSPLPASRGGAASGDVGEGCAQLDEAWARGREAAGKLPGAGVGLIGLRERVEVLGGLFKAGPHDGGGYEVVAVLPFGGNSDD